jgi:hypothetical protein
MSYTPPLRDLAFDLAHVVGGARLMQTAAFPGYDGDTQAAVLEAAGRFARDVLAPLNRAGDTTGSRIENGVVRTPAGFADAYRAFAAAGWNGLTASPDHGGQGLPRALALAAFETVHGANMAFGLCPLLTQSAIEALSAFGSDRQKALYLTRLVTGEWTGTMNLTEPQSGSDLAGIRTRADPAVDGHFRLFGQKIFITWGDHDMSGNIVHLVLARTPGAPEGTKGISLFLVPKMLVHEDGSPGNANHVRPSGIEHKLGIHASPTCSMMFDGAQAELVGDLNNGLAQMFTMMNAARLQVGMEGVGIAERAFQQALAYSFERRQGHSAWTGEYPAPIVDHPDIRRMLMLMKSRIVAARGLCLSTAVAADFADAASDAGERKSARLRAELLTPIAKAWATDAGVEIASLALQIHGGMGYIEETGVAQCFRDARIAPIYEGTNGIQAIDLVSRKLASEGGQAMGEVRAEIMDCVATMRAMPTGELSGFAERLEVAMSAAWTAAQWLQEAQMKSRSDSLAGATPFLNLLGDTIGGWMLAKGALAALRMDTAARSRVRVGLARFYGEHVLARSSGLAASAMAGDTDLRAVAPRDMVPG